MRNRLREAFAQAEGLVRPEDFNCFDFLERRYNYLRGFFPRFLRVIEFEGTRTAEPILQAVRALRYWNAEAIRKVPASVPLDFFPETWKPYVCPESRVDRHYYELCVLNQLHQALQNGDVWAVGGRRYGNVEDLFIPKDQWSTIRDECYEELGHPKDPQVWLDGALGKLTSQIGKTTKNLPTNPQVFVEDYVRILASISRVHLSEVYQQLQSEGFEFQPADFLHVSLYAFEHIIPYGQYFFNLRKKDRKEAFSKAHRI